MKSIKFRAFSYINKNSDRVENYDCLIKPLAAQGYEVDLSTVNNELLTLELNQKEGNAELLMKINGEEITFSAPCDAGLSGQEKYNTIVDANINEIIAAIEARMN